MRVNRVAHYNATYRAVLGACRTTRAPSAGRPLTTREGAAPAPADATDTPGDVEKGIIPEVWDALL